MQISHEGGKGEKSAKKVSISIWLAYMKKQLLKFKSELKYFWLNETICNVFMSKWV